MLYVLSEKPEVYDALPKSPSVPLSILVWKDFLKPVSLLAAGGILVGSFLHYLIHGPKLPDDAGDAGKKEGGE
ncbi:MAG: Formate dehydrogenase, nitrate-inducible, iron-sulfur subunit [Syntrophaceae bacterium PtaB.Bin038]|nr:MAG: Formate dehydrogenase, nitrate-inducible, iron-sulfur subunit [Syntrophaceae bacterium PtaB.Bin038]